MKKLLLCFLVSLLSLTGWAQNGGQANANDFLRIDYVGYSNGSHVFKIKNLQPCMEVVRYSFGGSSQNDTVVIFPYEAVYVSYPASQLTTVSAKAKVTDLCGVSAPDRGWVEVSSLGNVLQAKFVRYKVEKINAKQVRLVFTVDEDVSIDHYNIKLSRDGKTFKTVKVLFPNGVQETRTYTAIIDL